MLIKTVFYLWTSGGYADGPQCFYSSADVASVLFHVA